jgi:hypothetical protein
MSDIERLRSFAANTRKALEPGLHRAADGSADSAGSCLYASVLLASLLNRYAIAEARVVGGGACEGIGAISADGNWHGHYWVEARLAAGDVIVLDITADQFGHAPIRVLPWFEAAGSYRAGDQGEVDAVAVELARSFDIAEHLPQSACAR